ncbi:peptidase [Haloprofundus marisrubri]|uniref:Peptidase n=1 Tax=Haloprofundus marisrubri TaxID=1514971 RepID=A0A0W1R9X3_9EURY|nr:M24 family metallopeptidase [Haloprofundus marisrubri]KTG09509.1 peptidase [Haloprofundus marisrubri]
MTEHTDDNGATDGGSADTADSDRLADRRQRLGEYLDTAGLDAVWFARPNSFAWLTGGDNVVSATADLGVAAAGYVAPENEDAEDGEFRVVTDNIEAPRLVDEELPGEFTVETGQWYESSLAESVADNSPANAAADFDVPGFESVDASALRQPLSEGDIEAYRSLGRDTAAAVEQVCRQLESEDTEHEVASALRVTLSARGINAPVVLVGGSERAQSYRHYTPKLEPLGDYALVSVTAERDGLHASMTRTVAFDPPEWLAERHTKAMQVEATALGATRAVSRLGGSASSVFDGIQMAYEHVDYPDEWKHHHQGGAAGYAGREWFATPTADEKVHTPMAYAWNPTIQGAKSEDTVLVTEDGFEVLTSTGEWPTRNVVAIDYDDAVERHDVLTL